MECFTCYKPTRNKCKVCKLPYCSTACQHDDWKYHKLVCDRDFHIRVQKLLKLVSSGEYRCHNYNQYSARLFREEGDHFHVSVQASPPEADLLCLLCGRENEHLGPQKNQRIMVNGLDIWRCDECFTKDVRMCSLTYLPTIICQSNHLCPIIDRCMLIIALMDIVDLQKYMAKYLHALMKHVCR